MTKTIKYRYVAIAIGDSIKFKSLRGNCWINPQSATVVDLNCNGPIVYLEDGSKFFVRWPEVKAVIKAVKP
jgi:hypothetical protein